MKKELSRFGAVVSLVAVAVVIVNVVAWGYVSVVGVVVDYDSESFRNSLVEREDGNWYTPEGYLFVDGTCDRRIEKALSYKALTATERATYQAKYCTQSHIIK